MKKIIVAAMLFAGIATFAQSKKELIARGENLCWSVERSVKKDKAADESTAYANQKYEAIKPIFKWSEGDQEKFNNLFKSQYPALAETIKSYVDTKSLQSKLDFIKLLVQNEEAFRAMLTPEQLAAYIDYANENSSGGGITELYFQRNFFSQKQLESFKKELQ